MKIEITDIEKKEKSFLEKIIESAGRAEEEKKDVRQDVLDHLSNIKIEQSEESKKR